LGYAVVELWSSHFNKNCQFLRLFILYYGANFAQARVVSWAGLFGWDRVRAWVCQNVAGRFRACI